MVQVIEKAGSILGQMGRGIGGGVAGQAPEEMGRYRLSQGLQNFAKQAQQMSPLEQMAYLSSIPNVTPQMIQSFGELAKQQSIGNAFRNMGRNRLDQQAPPQATSQAEQFRQDLQNVPFANLSPTTRQRRGQLIPSEPPTEEQQAAQTPKIVSENPLQEKFIPKNQWTPEERFSNIGYIFEKFPGITLPEATAMANDWEQRELAQPTAEREKLAYREGVKEKAENALTKNLELLTHKTGKDLFKDIPGELQLGLKNGMEADLVKLGEKGDNPKSIDEVAQKWARIGFNQAKAKNDLFELGGRGIGYGYKPIEDAKSIQNIAKEFARAGNREALFKYLQSGEIRDENGTVVGKGMNLSPQRSAQFAYELQPKVKSYIQKAPKSPLTSDGNKRAAYARQQAKEIENLITSDDSLLTIAQTYMDMNPGFDIGSFFDQLSEDMETLPLNSQQRRDITQRGGTPVPTWGDIYFAPFFWGGKL